MNRSGLAAFVRLGRPKFLLQSMLVVGLGVTVPVTLGHQADIGRFWLVLLFTWCVHLMTHYCNEYFDLEADRANTTPTRWTGGSRVLVSGRLTPAVSLGTAFVLLFGALFLIAVMPSPAARLIAAALVTLAWLYTAPPLRLNYRGLGEATCALALYALCPMLACHLQMGTIPPRMAAVAAVLFGFQLLRMMIMNLADIDGDRGVGKRTLAVLLGARRLVIVFALGQALTHLLAAALAAAGVLPPPAAGLLLLTAPLPIWLSRRLLAGDLHAGADAGTVTFWSSMHLPIAVIALMTGLLWDALAHDVPTRGWPAYCLVLAATLPAFLLHQIPRTKPATPEAR